MSQVTLKIDINNGTMEIQADADVFDGVATGAVELLERISAGIEFRQPEQPSQHLANQTGNAPPESGVDQPATKGKERKRRPSGTTKVKNLKIIDDLLQPAQRAALKTFVQEKNPRNQNELVAVLAFKLKEFTERSGFSDDEIHTAVQAVGRKTPANLRAVFGNMTADGLGKQEDGRFIPNFKCDDLVNHDLPHKVKADG